VLDVTTWSSAANSVNSCWFLEMPLQNMPEAKVSNPTAGLSCSGPVIHSGEILTTDNSHKKQPDGLLTQEDSEMKKLLQFIHATCNFRGLKKARRR
jgi:hypothetical protein